MTHRFNILFILLVNMILITENIKGQNIGDSCIYSPLIKVSDAILIRTDKLNKKQVLSKMSEHIEKLD